MSGSLINKVTSLSQEGLVRVAQYIDIYMHQSCNTDQNRSREESRTHSLANHKMSQILQTVQRVV